MDKFSAIPERDQVDENFKWRLQDIYENEQEWEDDRQAVTDLLSGFQGYEGRLGESAKTLLAVLTRRKQIEQFIDKLFAYARMHRDENAANTKYQAMTGKIQSLMAKASAAYAFIEPELLTIPAVRLKEFLAQEPELSEYQFYFTNLLRQKDHILSPQEEALLSRLAEVTQSSAETFQMLARADMKFPNIVNQDGSKLPLSEGRYHSFIISPDRFLRQQAFKKLLGTYRSYRNTFATTLGGNIKQDLFYAKTRGYKSQLAAALTPDNIPLSLYDQLIKTVNQYLPSLHRYVEIKKRALKLPEIHMYDLYTPLVADIKLSYSYPEALALVEKALAPLGENYLAELKRGFEAGWIDVYENRGKQTGAYSWGVYGVHPFVLLNFNGRYEDVSTLAHEMGHALHSFFSHTTQPYATSSYTIFCAEVASTTNEILLMDHMLKTVSDPKIRLYLINQLLETIRGTVYRQTLFAEFEKAAYSLAESGESITADWLDQLWHNLNIKYYGSTIVVDPENDVEWARIPHFYRSFYVYKYATGYSAATALAHKIETEGEPAQNRYLQFLRSGGSDYSLELLKQAGVDMTGPTPVEQTLTKFTDLLNQVEENLL